LFANRPQNILLRIVTLALCSLACAETDPRADLVKQKVEEISKALISGAFGKVVDLTYPKIVEMIGGRDKMIKLLDSTVQQMRDDGTVFTAVKVGTPSEFRSAGSDLFVIVPTSIELKVPGGKLTQKAFTVGISSDAGRTWSFVDGANLNDDKIKIVVPNFPATLQLPSKQPPVFERTP